MKNAEWEQFAELLHKVVSLGGPWKEKAAKVIEQIDTYGTPSDLPEFLSWFDDEGEVAE